MRRCGIEQARREFKKLIAEANDSGNPVTITFHGNRVAVLMPGRLTVDLLRGLHMAPEMITMALALAGETASADPEDIKFVERVARVASEIPGRVE